jgi:hypothetical protein
MMIKLEATNFIDQPASSLASVILSAYSKAFSNPEMIAR